MCICHLNEPCPCYRDAREYRHEQTRQAIASRIEHAVLDLLRDSAAPVASPLAARLADLIRSWLDHDERVSDVLVTGRGGVFYWLDGDGSQHYARLDENAAAADIRLVA